MKNKLLILPYIFMLIVCAFSTNVCAVINSSNCTLSTPKNEYSIGEEIVLTFRLDSLNADRGIISYSAVLEYDKTALEYVSSSGCREMGNTII